MVEPKIMAPVLEVSNVLRALMQVVRSPWWIQGPRATLAASLCAVCEQQLQEHVVENDVLLPSLPRNGYASHLPSPDRPAFYANSQWVVKVMYIGDVRQPSMSSEEARRAAAASIDACITDVVVARMGWAGRSFGLIVCTHTYICVLRSRLFQVNTLHPDSCARFFCNFCRVSGISHSNPHAGYVGERSDRIHEAFGFARSTIIDSSCPNAEEAELRKYAQAVRDGNYGDASLLRPQARQRSGLCASMDRFTRLWMTPVAGYAVAFTRDTLYKFLDVHE